MRLSRKTAGAILLAVAMVVGLAPSAFAAAEDTLLAKLNAERSSRGLATLESHWDLVDDAEAHSHRMMDADRLHHNPNLSSVTTGWLALGENVGLGPSANSIHNAFMNSNGHRANILGDFTHVGIGAVRENENKLWVTVVFMKAQPESPTTTVAPTTTSTTQPPATTQAPTTTAAPTVTTTTSAPQGPPTTAAPAAPRPESLFDQLGSRRGPPTERRFARLLKHWPI